MPPHATRWRPAARAWPRWSRRSARRVLAPDRSLDRAAMRRRVFEDPEARRVLETIIHPGCARRWKRPAPGPTAVRHRPRSRCWPKPAAAPPIPGCPHPGGGRASDGAASQRLLRRDGIDTALAEAMIAAQATRAQRLAIAGRPPAERRPAGARPRRWKPWIGCIGTWRPLRRAATTRGSRRCPLPAMPACLLEVTGPSPPIA